VWFVDMVDEGDGGVLCGVGLVGWWRMIGIRLVVM